MDVPFDPCLKLAEIDFSDEETLINILKRDKHTRIEGLCTEKLFLKQLIEGTFADYSVGWWFTLKRRTYRIIKFCRDLGEISATDLAVLDFFKEKGVSTFVVGYDESKNNFFYVDYAKLPPSNKLTEWVRERVPFPAKQRRSPPVPKPAERNAARLRQAISLLQSLNMLRNAALERVFANCWLAGRVYWDIDCFVRYDNRILAFEVKQKYPTAKGTFGLNLGLARLFTFLTHLGIEVYHVILTKPTRDYRIPAIDFYTKDKYKSKLDWLGLRFSPKFLSQKSSLAPRKTSIFGATGLRYFHLQPGDFHFLKNLDSSTSHLSEFIDGGTKPISRTKSPFNN